MSQTSIPKRAETGLPATAEREPAALPDQEAETRTLPPRPAPDAPPPERSEMATVPPQAPTAERDSPAAKPPVATEASGDGGEAAAPAIIPGYEILGELGRGGMGVVYKARQLKLGRVVALKTILAGAHAGATGRARFHTEAEAVARLQHPNVVQIYEIGAHDGLPYFSLEYCSGGNLHDQLDGTPWAPRRAAEMIATLADAVEAAHRAGVVHRDLKPANVLLTETNTPKISDFGLAKKVGESGHTASGAILGTPSYMAPEQAGGQAKTVGPPADIYALGAILYELLTGRPPFKAATSLDTILLVVSEEPVPPSRLQPAIPRDLETACLKCLQKDPAKRYPSARALGDDLGRFLRSEPILARPVGSIERFAKWARRRPALASLVAVLVAATIGLIALMVWHSHDLQLRVDQAVEDADRAKREVALGKVITRGQAALAQDTPDALKEAETVLNEALDADKRNDFDTVTEARAILKQVQSRIAQRDEQQAARKRAQQKLDAFGRLRDQALQHSTLSIGDDLVANLKSTTEAARTALAQFGVTGAGDQPPALDAALTAEEREQVTEDCYLLLAIWAEAESELRRPDVALRLLQRADGLKIETRAAHLRRARYLQALDRKAEAKDEERRAEALQPTRAVDYYLLGDERYKQGDLKNAAVYFDDVLGPRPKDFWARYFLAACYVRSDRFDEAQTYLTECIGRQPGFVWLYLMRGFANGQRKQSDAAELDFARAEQLLKEHPDDEARYALYTNRGVLRAGTPGRTADAVADLKQAIAIRPRRYQAYLSLAQIYQTQADLRRLLLVCPAPYQACGLLAQLAHTEASWNTALMYFNQGIAQDPNSPFLDRNRAKLYLERERLDEALRDYDRSIAAERAAGSRGDSLELARDLTQRGLILYQRGQSEDAVNAFAEAVQVRPGYTKAYLCRAEVLLKLERYEAAIAALDAYDRQGGKPRVEVYQARGQALTRLGRYADAVQAYTLALNREPRDSALYAARGWLQLAAHATEPALQDFEHAVEFNPRNGNAFNGRGQARAALGRYKEAVADAEMALRLGPVTHKVLADAARTYALAVNQVDAERTKLPPGAPRAKIEPFLRLHTEYVRKSVALLRRALDTTPTDPERARLWKERVEGDAALEAVRGSAEFGRLRADYAGLAGKVSGR